MKTKSTRTGTGTEKRSVCIQVPYGLHVTVSEKAVDRGLCATALYSKIIDSYFDKRRELYNKNRELIAAKAPRKERENMDSLISDLEFSVNDVYKSGVGPKDGKGPFDTSKNIRVNIRLSAPTLADCLKSSVRFARKDSPKWMKTRLTLQYVYLAVLNKWARRIK